MCTFKNDFLFLSKAVTNFADLWTEETEQL